MGKLIACLSECALRFGFAELMCGNHLFLLQIVGTLPVGQKVGQKVRHEEEGPFKGDQIMCKGLYSTCTCIHVCKTAYSQL